MLCPKIRTQKALLAAACTPATREAQKIPVTAREPVTGTCKNMIPEIGMYLLIMNEVAQILVI